jgi:hypothetical protein
MQVPVKVRDVKSILSMNRNAKKRRSRKEKKASLKINNKPKEEQANLRMLPRKRQSSLQILKRRLKVKEHS